MHAGFVFHLAVDFVAADQRGHFLQSADGRFAGGSDFHVPPARFREAPVHAENLGGEQRSLVAAGAGVNFEHHVLFIVRILGQQQNLQLVFDSRDLRLQLRATSSSAMARNSGSDSASMGRASARLRVASFHSRYLATISASSLCDLDTLRYSAESLMTAGVRHLGVQLVEPAFDVVEFLLILHSALHYRCSRFRCLRS